MDENATSTPPEEIPPEATTSEPIIDLEAQLPNPEGEISTSTPILEPQIATTTNENINLGVELPKNSETKVQPSLNNFLALALAKIQFRKQAKLEKIIKLAREKGTIRNDDVEKLLHVSHATATRYLEFLTKNSRLKSTGTKQGRVYSL